jgi:hypothetical protein
MKVGGIINHITNLRVVQLLLRHLFKPVVLDAIECGGTVTGKLAQPPDGIAFSNPEFKPVLALIDTDVASFPNKCSLTP